MNKKELNKLAREFRMFGSRLLSTKYGNGMSDLSRFLNFIESNEMVYDFILKNNSYQYDMKAICNDRGWHNKYDLPVEKDKEIAFIYQLLKYGQEAFGDYTAFTHGYGSGKKFQDHMDAFNNQVVKHLVDYIREYLEDLIIDSDDQLLDNDSQEKRIFISYSWTNKDIADIIDEDFSKLGYPLTRDERDIRYKDSIKEFMQQIGKHDFVIMLISDSYLKSENCMYEVMEVIRDREYKKKILMIVLADEDKKFYKNYEKLMAEEPAFNALKVGAEIYSSSGRIGYTEYWETCENEMIEQIARIQNDINKIQPLKEQKRINNISNNISDFLDGLRDWKAVSLQSLKETNYAEIINCLE
jgi:TIR domain.